MGKDTLERAIEPNLNVKGYLTNAYLHPIFKIEENDDNEMGEWRDDDSLVLTKRDSKLNTPRASENNYLASPEYEVETYNYQV